MIPAVISLAVASFALAGMSLVVGSVFIFATFAGFGFGLLVERIAHGS